MRSARGYRLIPLCRRAACFSHAHARCALARSPVRSFCIGFRRLLISWHGPYAIPPRCRQQINHGLKGGGRGEGRRVLLWPRFHSCSTPFRARSADRSIHHATKFGKEGEGQFFISWIRRIFTQKSALRALLFAQAADFLRLSLLAERGSRRRRRHRRS